MHRTSFKTRQKHNAHLPMLFSWKNRPYWLIWKNLNFQNGPYFRVWRKFGFCDRSFNMTDFDTKMRAKGVSYAFDLHLNKWNSYPWHQFSWKLIFEVTPPNLAISAHPKIHIFWKKTRLWVKFRNFCISIKTWDLQLYSLEIWSISGMNSRNASHFTYRAFFVRSRYMFHKIWISLQP